MYLRGWDEFLLLYYVRYVFFFFFNISFSFPFSIEFFPCFLSLFLFVSFYRFPSFSLSFFLSLVFFSISLFFYFFHFFIPFSFIFVYLLLSCFLSFFLSFYVSLTTYICIFFTIKIHYPSFVRSFNIYEHQFQLITALKCFLNSTMKKVKLAKLVECDPKVPFSIGTTESCRGGHYSTPLIAPLYP